MKTIFELIIDGEIPSTIIYEDDICISILDINPVNKGHALVISKTRYPVFTQCPKEELSHMMEIAKKIDLKLRDELKCEGTNILINNDPASGQEVFHLHIHVIPRYTNDGNKFNFNKKTYSDGEINKMGELLKI